MVDYDALMTTEALLREQPTVTAAASTRNAMAGLEPRVRGVIKTIFQVLLGFHPASRQQLQKAVKKNGFSEAEFAAAWQCLEETTVDGESARRAVAVPAKASSSASKSALKTLDPAAAGERLVEELREAEGGAWTGAELQAQFALTPAVLHRRRKEYRILSWRDAQHAFHYPRWQFTGNGALLPGMQEVLQTFRSDDEWRLMAYFLGPRRQLGDARPLDLLRAGEQEKVLAHATLHAEENTW